MRNTCSITGEWTGAFPGCNLQCTKGGCVTLVSGAHAGQRVWVDGPEYETAAGFGSNLGIWNAEFIMEANWHCDNYGIDTITTAGVMAFLMECFQRGYLDGRRRRRTGAFLGR